MVLLFSSSIDSIAELKSHFNRLAMNLWEYDRVIFLPNSGVGVLPPAALEVRSVLFKNPQIEEFNLSKRLQDDPFIYQRIVEGVWPRVFVASSPYLFIGLDELPDYPGKEIAAQGGKIALVITD